MARTVAIRFGTEGKAQVKADLDDIGNSGDANAKRWARSFERAGQDVEAAMQRQANAAAKLSAIMPQSAMQMQVNAAAGSNTRFGGGYAASGSDRSMQWEGSARTSAAAFRELYAEEERLEARTRALITAIDPAWAAQERFNARMKEAKTLLDAGRISTEQYAAAEALARRETEAINAARDESTQSLGAQKAGYQQLSYQVGDVVASLASGSNPATVFAQQAGQVVQALQLIAGDGSDGGGAAGASDAIGGMTDTLGGANDAFDAATGASERLNTVVGAGTAATETNTAATGGNTASRVTQTGATGGATLATETNTLATAANTASTETNAVATTGLAAAKARLLAFMAGPWGAAVIGGVTILGLLAQKYFEADDSADKTTKTLEFQVGSIEALDAVTKTLNETLGQSVRTQGQVRAEAISTANANLAAAESARQRAVQEIALARALLAQQVTRSRIGGERGDMAAMSLPGQNKAQDDQEEALVKLETKIQSATVARNNLVAEDRRLRANETADRVDADAKLVAATGKTGAAERALADIRQKGRAELAAGTLTEAGYQARVVAGEKALDAAREADKKHGKGREESLARQAQSMEVNAAAAIDLARAYLIGGDAAVRAEAARKGLTDATKKGIDAEAQVRRQLAVMVGDQVADGAKSVAQLRDETAARSAVIAQVAAGNLPVDQMNQALADEAALRPLLKLQTLAQGDALKALTEVIDAYRGALKDAHEQEAQFGLEKALSDSIDRVEEIKAQIGDMSLSPLAAALDQAKRAAVREADAQRYAQGPERTSFINSRIAEAEQGYYQQRARYVMDALNGQQDGIVLARAEMSLLAANDNVRSVELEKLRIMLDIRRRFPDLAEADAQAIMAGVDAQAAAKAELERTAAAMDELRGFGTDFVETILSEDTWESWGSAGRTILDMLKSEFIKLALLNPIRNLINGGDAPTIGGVLGNIGKLFGGTGPSTAVTSAFGVGGAGTAGSAAGGSGLAKLASGTERWSGGTALLGEHGAEVAHLPAGTRVQSAEDTRRLFAGNDNRRPSVTYNTFTGNLMTPEFWAQVQAGDDSAAMRGAAGGAQISEAETQARGQRRLGRFG